MTIMTPRQYKLFLSRSQKLMLIAPIAAFLVMPLLFLSVLYQGVIPTGRHPAEIPAFFPWIPIVIFPAAAAWFIWLLLTTPREIIVGADGKLVFKSVLGLREVKPADVISIEPKTLQLQIGMSGYQLRHVNGKIVYPGQFTGMHQLLAELKQANPAVEIKGC